jgi:hypothetical protein
MATAASALASILARARQGWNAEQPENAHGLLNRLSEKLRAEFAIIESDDDTITFLADLNRIRLRGANDAACLLAAGDSQRVASSVRKFWDASSGPEQLIIVFALTEAAEEAVRASIPAEFVCLLGAVQIGRMLDSLNAVEDLKREIRAQIPPRRLVPFVIKHSVRGNMFYGRKHELKQLIEEDAENFVIAGQGRIGKSSIIDEYRRQLALRKDPRLGASFYIDFYTCQPRSEAAIVQFLAKGIDGTTNRTRNLSLEDLESFLRFQVHTFKHKLDLMLDEVDLVCASKTFNNLVHLSRKKEGPIARLILAGRRELLRKMTSEDSPLGNHAWLMRLEPLDEESARKLLIEPLADMGARFADDRALVDWILQLTGRLPQLIQYFGGKLAKLICGSDSVFITRDHIESIRISEEATDLFMSPVRDVKDPLAELVALLVVERGIQKVDPGLVANLARGACIEVDAPWALRICDDLLLSNFLAWTKSGYQVANLATALRVKETGYLASALDNARQQVKRRYMV